MRADGRVRDNFPQLDNPKEATHARMYGLTHISILQKQNMLENMVFLTHMARQCVPVTLKINHVNLRKKMLCHRSEIEEKELETEFEI